MTSPPRLKFFLFLCFSMYSHCSGSSCRTRMGPASSNETARWGTPVELRATAGAPQHFLCASIAQHGLRGFAKTLMSSNSSVESAIRG